MDDDQGKKLSLKQRKFVIEYMKDLNATQAATRAGYSKKTARQIGQRLLTKVNIQKEIQMEFEKVGEKASLDVQWVIKHLVEITNRCMQKIPVMEYDKENKCYKQKIDSKTGLGIWTFNASGANKAVENIGRHLGMFRDNINAKIENDKLVELLQQARKRVGKD